MRWVFEEIFAECGADLADHVALRAGRDPGPARLEAAASGSTSSPIRTPRRRRSRTSPGPREARRLPPVLRPGRRGLRDPGGAVHPRARGRARRPRRAGPACRASATSGASSPSPRCGARSATYFRDPRLRQLFGRYATYCGSSPFAAPATLMLVAHVEQPGRLARGAAACSRLAGAVADARRGARRRLPLRDAPVAASPSQGGRVVGVVLADGERIAADAVVCNADVAALAAGLLGPRRGPGRRAAAACRALALGGDPLRCGAGRGAFRWRATPSSSPATTRRSSTRSAARAPAGRSHGLRLRAGPDRRERAARTGPSACCASSTPRRRPDLQLPRRSRHARPRCGARLSALRADALGDGGAR